MDRFCNRVASLRLTALSEDQFDGYGVIHELGTILRGEHPNWKGDRRENGYWFLKTMWLTIFQLKSSACIIFDKLF